MRVLDYDGALKLRLIDEDMESFRLGVLYKMQIKRYVRECYPDWIRFRPELSYIKFKRIIEIFKVDELKTGNPVVVSPALEEYIQQKDIYIESRAKAGIELKHHDEKLLPMYEEYKAVVDEAMVRPLREMQMWDSFFMFSMRKCANFSVPGSGKTASVLGVYAFLKHQKQVRRIVVICPKNAFGSWIDEFQATFGNKEKLNYISIQEMQGKTPAQRSETLLYDSGSANLILVNYEAVRGVDESLKKLIGSETLLVFDEIHKVKRIGGIRAHDALYVSQNANYVIGLTGTPIPNSYEDIYNLLHILFPDEYDDFFGFTSAELHKADGGLGVQTINGKIQPFFCRTTKHQLGVPPANEDAFIELEASEIESQLESILVKKYRSNKLALMIRILQLETNPLYLLESLNLKDFAYILDEDAEDIDDIDFIDYSEEIQDLIKKCSRTSTKFNACVKLASMLVEEGKPTIIWCIFLDSINKLANVLNAQGIKCRCIYGEVPLEERQDILDDFKKGNIQVLITNPHTLAESVSLHSVCHDAIYYEYSYNLVHLLQSKDRIHRLGLPQGQYTQYYFMQIDYPQIVDSTILIHDVPVQQIGSGDDEFESEEAAPQDVSDGEIVEDVPVEVDVPVNVVFSDEGTVGFVEEAPDADIQYEAAVFWSMDREIYNRLKFKEGVMLNAIDHDVLESMPTDEEDLDNIFQGCFVRKKNLPKLNG